MVKVVGSIPTSTIFANLAHLVEQEICNFQVAGSSPAVGLEVLTATIAALLEDG